MKFSTPPAAVVYQPPPGDALLSVQHYQFLANNEVDGAGTTCAGAACVDLVMVAPDLRQDVCIQINELLDVSNPGGVPPVDDDINEDDFFAPGPDPFTNPGLETIGDDDPSLTGQREGCLAETGENPDEYVYFKVLLAR